MAESLDHEDVLGGGYEPYHDAAREHVPDYGAPAAVDDALAAVKARFDHAAAPYDPDVLGLIRQVEAMREKLYGPVRADPMPVFVPNRPSIVVLCGSTRFYDQFQAENYRLTMAGTIVLSVGFYPHATGEHGHGEGVGHDSAEKITLDELHKRKIDLADSVRVLNVGGYIGESTRSEIEYAQKLGKPISYLEADHV